MLDQQKLFLTELQTHGAVMQQVLHNDQTLFAKSYQAYLEGLSDDDIAKVKAQMGVGFFGFSKTDCNKIVKETAETLRKNLLKSQLFELWKDKTGTKNPYEWSHHYQTPILCCVPTADFEHAKRAFDILHHNTSTDADIQFALNVFQHASWLEALSDQAHRDACFMKEVVGVYETLLPNMAKIRTALDSLGVQAYDWHDHPKVKQKIKQLADAEYHAGGSDQVLVKIEQMDDALLKQYLKRLVKENMAVGIELLADRG